MNLYLRDLHSQKWKLRFMEMAAHVSAWSKDPSTKVGAVIVSGDRRSISAGYNGFPPKMDDAERFYKDREYKYRWVVHAEVNAVLNAGFDVRGCVLYCTHAPCTRCASVLITAGIKAVHYLHVVPGSDQGIEGLRDAGIWAGELLHPELLKAVDSNTRCC